MDHPDYRAEHAFLRVLRLPFAGLGHAERTFLAAALYARYGGSIGDKLTAEPCELLSVEERERASPVVAVLRLGHTLSGRAVEVLNQTRLQVTADSVLPSRPDERRGGQECVSRGSTRWPETK